MHKAYLIHVLFWVLGRVSLWDKGYYQTGFEDKKKDISKVRKVECDRKRKVHFSSKSKLTLKMHVMKMSATVYVSNK